MTLSDALEKAWVDSDAWEASAQANYKEACKHRKAAEEMYDYIGLMWPENSMLENYQEYKRR